MDNIKIGDMVLCGKGPGCQLWRTTQLEKLRKSPFRIAVADDAKWDDILGVGNPMLHLPRGREGRKGNVSRRDDSIHNNVANGSVGSVVAATDAEPCAPQYRLVVAVQIKLQSCSAQQEQD